jgi:transcriptional regulator with XRE-family HTH domain
VNRQEQQVSAKLSKIMRAARKRLGLTQVAVARKMGITQGSLSKLESGQLVASAPQWFTFCEFTGISADSLITGYIERNRPAMLRDVSADESGYRIPKRYSTNSGSKVRAMLPFLHFFQQKLGETRLSQFLVSLGLDPDFFVDLDNQLSLNFCVDISKYLIRHGYMKPKHLLDLTSQVAQPRVHGSLHRYYDGSAGATALLQVLTLNSRQYECNFRYQLEAQSRSQLVLSVHPEKHLSEINHGGDDDLGDFLCRYKRSYFERFSSYGGSAAVSFSDVECQYHGDDRCVYRAQLAR